MTNEQVIETLNNLFVQLKLKAKINSCKVESSFLVLDVKLLPGGVFKKIERHSTEIALALKALSIPLIYPITKDGIVRLEMMIAEQQIVWFSELKSNDGTLPLVLGSFRDGTTLIADLEKMPHLLIAGTTGSGKSILLHSIINSLINRENIKFVLIDPKRVEFTYYNGLTNLYCPVAKDTESALSSLENLIAEMEKRFIKLEKAGARDIINYKGIMPYIVVIIDELADLMMSSKKDTQDLLCKLAQKSRACGIYIVAATQRPSVNIITGSIKANFPARISCKVSSAIDSRIILDRSGAETLVGNGDAIIDCNEFEFKRFKGAFITEEEIINNVNSKKSWWNKIWNS